MIKRVKIEDEGFPAKKIYSLMAIATNVVRMIT
jgi:hypothetical protein